MTKNDVDCRVHFYGPTWWTRLAGLRHSHCVLEVGPGILDHPRGQFWAWYHAGQHLAEDPPTETLAFSLPADAFLMEGPPQAINNPLRNAWRYLTGQHQVANCAHTIAWVLGITRVRSTDHLYDELRREYDAEPLRPEGPA